MSICYKLRTDLCFVLLWLYRAFLIDSIQWCHMNVKASKITATRFSFQQLVKANNKEMVKGPYYWPFWIQRWPVDSPDKDQWCGNGFHAMSLSCLYDILAHCRRENSAIIGADSGLSADGSQAIIWTTVGKVLIGHTGTNISEIIIEIQTFPFRKMHLKMSSGKCRPFCLGLNVFTLILQNRFTGTGTMLRLSRCWWNNLTGYG